jgi:hypothetical protein
MLGIDFFGASGDWQPQGQEGRHAPALSFLLREKKDQSGGMGGVPSGAAPLGCYTTLPSLGLKLQT